jgi:hypothetical protein
MSFLESEFAMLFSHDLPTSFTENVILTISGSIGIVIGISCNKFNYSRGFYGISDKVAPLWASRVLLTGTICLTLRDVSAFLPQCHFSNLTTEINLALQRQ